MKNKIYLLILFFFFLNISTSFAERGMIAISESGGSRNYCTELQVPSGTLTDLGNRKFGLAFPLESLGAGASQYQYIVTDPNYSATWSSGHLNITASKTLSCINNISLSGTDGKSLTLTGSLTVPSDMTLGTIATQAANNVNISGGIVSGITDLAVADGGTGTSNGSITGTTALTFTPASGSNLNVVLGTTGDFVVNTNQLYVDTSEAKVGIGTAAPGGLLHLATPTIYLGQAIFEQASGDIDSFDLTLRKARGTIAAPTVITTADELGFINFAGYSGAAGYVTGAAIKAYSSGTVATTRVPANLRFYTGTDAAPTVLTERMRITNAGLIGIGEDTPTSQLFVKSSSATNKTLTLKMAASQSVNSFEIVDSTDVAKVSVASTGVATFANDVYANGNLYTGGLDYGINPGVVNVVNSSVDPNSVITTAHGYKFSVDGSPTALFQRLSKGDGTTDTPSATFVGALNYGASATGTDDYAITLPLAPLAYTTGMVVVCKADVICSGSCSLNVNTLGAKSLKVQYNIDPPDGYIKAGSIFIAIYDGTNFQIGFPILNNREMSYGVAWNETTDSYTRIGNASGFPVATTMPDTLLPIQANMKRCLLKDDGTINYFLYPSNSAFKVDGSTASVLTGADGQVMVRIPKFWYRYRYIAPVHYWEISPVALSDFDVHPAFIKNGVEVDYRYIGAYEGVLYDTSISQYVDGLAQSAWSCTFALADSSITANSRTAPFKNLTIGQKLEVTGTSLNNGTVTVASLVSDTKITVSEVLVNETAASTVIETQKDYTATTGDKLSSVSGFAPVTNFTRANSRVMGSNRGSGWRQLDYSLVSAIQLLYLTEYASFYSQSMIGAGITNVTDWPAYNDYNPIARSGNSNPIGNATGNTAGSTSAATEVTKYLSYRGIENWFGHIWKFTDGININNNIPYMTNNATNWADDTATNYVRPNNVLGSPVTLINTNGYQATLQSISEGFLPKTVGASSSTQITDYYYQNSGWRVTRLGGGSYDGAYAGGFFWGLSSSSAVLSQLIGGRLSF